MGYSYSPLDLSWETNLDLVTEAIEATCIASHVDRYSLARHLSECAIGVVSPSFELLECVWDASYELAHAAGSHPDRATAAACEDIPRLQQEWFEELRSND